MQTKWHLGSAALPGAGEPVDFLLWNRSIPIHGAFTDGVFHARWADYGIDRVESWCMSDVQMPDASATASGFSFRSMLNKTLNRWSHPSGRTPSADPD